jgi:hypothetical protein
MRGQQLGQRRGVDGPRLLPLQHTLAGAGVVHHHRHRLRRHGLARCKAARASGGRRWAARPPPGPPPKGRTSAAPTQARIMRADDRTAKLVACPARLRRNRLRKQAVHVLAFDTSTERLAVHWAHRSQITPQWPGGAAASATLLPQVQALLDASRPELGRPASHGLWQRAWRLHRPAHRLCRGAGPGPSGLGKPLLPIDSLLIVAEDARLQSPPPEARWTSAWRWTRAWTRCMPHATAGQGGPGRCCRRRRCTPWRVADAAWLM